MTRTGDTISQFDALFADWFHEPLAVRNYTAGETDDYGDTAKELASETETDGQLTQPDDPVEVTTARGTETTTDANILVPSELFVTDGTDAHPYPSEIERVADGTVYTAVSVTPEGNGLQRVDAVAAERSGSESESE